MKMLRAVTFALAAVLAFTLPARSDNAFTSAQYLDDTTGFASGYSYALWVNAISVADYAPGSASRISDRQIRMRACFIGVNFDSDNLHQAVIRHLREKPQELVQPAFVAVFQTFLEPCPD